MKRPIILALIALTLLPPVAFAGVSGAWMILGQVGPLDVAHELGDKSLAYWFLALAGIAIGSWTWIFRWMISQLDAQRTANGQLVDKLLEVHKDENTNLRDLQAKTVGVLERTVNVLDRVSAKL